MILTYQVNELTQPVGELFTCAQTKLTALSNKKIAKKLSRQRGFYSREQTKLELE